MSVDITEAARNRWPAMLPSLGVPSHFLRNQGGPCPICKEGKDRFRFDDKDGRGTYYCNRCEAGDGFTLVMKVNGWTFTEAKAEVEKVIGVAPAAAHEQAKSERSLTSLINSTWKASRLIAPGSAAFDYLQRRLGMTEFSRELRANGRLYHREPNGASPTHHPAMLARVRTVDGKPWTLHRTYLTLDGRKADVPEPRMVMPRGGGEKAMPDGCAIRLAAPAEVLGVSEGIENAISATILFGTPCWSLISSSIMPKWRPPAGVRKVIVYADRDVNYVGQQAAVQLARQLIDQKIEAEVQMPETHGEDWNDVLMRQLGAASCSTREAVA